MENTSASSHLIGGSTSRNERERDTPLYHDKGLGQTNVRIIINVSLYNSMHTQKKKTIHNHAVI